MNPNTLRTQMPAPFDLYPAWKEPRERNAPLTPSQERLVLSAFPGGAVIREAKPQKDWAYFPLRVRVTLPGNEEQTVFLRKYPRIGGIEREASLLPVLAQLGLPVPALLAGPVVDPQDPETGAMVVLSELPGESLLSWCWNATADRLAQATRLVLEGVARLHRLTDALLGTEVAARLDRRTLRRELEDIVHRGGPWFEETVFAQAVKRLDPVVSAIESPLVFSSGDYNPGNFLIEDDRLTGFLDFPWAGFEDPLYGFTKYWTYDWYPLDRVGLVERYLYEQDLRRSDFAPRLAVRCLWTLQREIPVEDAERDHSAYRDLQLRLLREAMASVAR